MYWQLGNGRQIFVDCNRTARYTFLNLKGNKSVSELKEKRTRPLIVCRRVSDSMMDIFIVETEKSRTRLHFFLQTTSNQTTLCASIQAYYSI